VVQAMIRCGRAGLVALSFGLGPKWRGEQSIGLFSA
jgi:hypothetical protein